MPGAVVARGIVVRQVILAQSSLRRIYRRSNCRWSNCRRSNCHPIRSICRWSNNRRSIYRRSNYRRSIYRRSNYRRSNSRRSKFRRSNCRRSKFRRSFCRGAIIAEQLSPSAEQLSQEQLSPEHMSDHRIYMSSLQCDGLGNLYPEEILLMTCLEGTPGYGREPAKEMNLDVNILYTLSAFTLKSDVCHIDLLKCACIHAKHNKELNLQMGTLFTFKLFDLFFCFVAEVIYRRMIFEVKSNSKQQSQSISQTFCELHI